MRVAGLGFRAAAPLSSLRAALQAVEAEGGTAQALATLAMKADAPALRELAQERGLPVLVAKVAGVQTPTQSPRVMALHGTGSVAEAAALVACGPGAKITVARRSAPDGMATCAMAESEGTKE